MTDLWTEASRDVEAEILDRHLTTARVAAAPLWPTLAAAVSPEDYANRKALIADRIERIAQAVAEGDPALFGVVHAGLLDGLDSDFTVLHTERTAKRIEAETKSRAAQAKEAALRERLQAETVRRVLAAESGDCPNCGHSWSDHSDKPGNDGRAGCVKAVGIARCSCTKTGPDKTAAKQASRKTAVSLTNVGIEGDYGVGTDPSGKRVKFTLSEKDRADLTAVLHSDLNVNFSGVTVDESDLVSEASSKQASRRTAGQDTQPVDKGQTQPCPSCGALNNQSASKCWKCEKAVDFSKTSRRVAARIDDLRKIVADKQYGTIDGMMVDTFTASHLVAVHDALKPENQAKFDSIPLERLVDFAFKATSALRAQADVNPFAKKDDDGAKKPADNTDAGAPDPVSGQNDVWTCPNCQSTDAYTQGGKNLDEALKAKEPIKCGSCQQVDTSAGQTDPQHAQDPQQQAPNQAPVATPHASRSRRPFVREGAYDGTGVASSVEDALAYYATLSPGKGQTLASIAFAMGVGNDVARRRVDAAIARGTVVNSSNGASMSLRLASKTAGSLDGFWADIERELTELRSARNADDVLRILGTDPELQDSGAQAFFAGGGGDGTVLDALVQAGWNIPWREADYYFVAQAPDGSKITYVEGDVYKGDTSVRNSSRKQAEYQPDGGVYTGGGCKVEGCNGTVEKTTGPNSLTGVDRFKCSECGQTYRGPGKQAAAGDAWEHGLGDGEGQVYSCYLDADCDFTGTAAEMEEHYKTSHPDSSNRELLHQGSRRTAGVVVPVDAVGSGYTYYESPTDVPDQYGAMTPITLYTVTDEAGHKYHGEPVITVAGPFLSRDKASWAAMRKGDWVGWDGIEIREQTVYPYDNERHTRWGSKADPDLRAAMVNAAFNGLVREAGNPYQPTDNPYTNDPPVQPGTPDDTLDGPADTNPLSQIDAPVTTRPRQQPSGAPAENAVAPAAEPTSVTTKPKAAARGFTSTAFKVVAMGTPGDPTQFGVGGDHCPHCGADWKQPHDGDCLRNTSPAAAAALEAEGEKALEADNARWRSENPGPHTCPICSGSGKEHDGVTPCRNCGGKGSWTYTSTGERA